MYVLILFQASSQTGGKSRFHWGCVVFFAKTTLCARVPASGRYEISFLFGVSAPGVLLGHFPLRP